MVEDAPLSPGFLTGFAHRNTIPITAMAIALAQQNPQAYIVRLVAWVLFMHLVFVVAHMPGLAF